MKHTTRSPSPPMDAIPTAPIAAAPPAAPREPAPGPDVDMVASPPPDSQSAATERPAPAAPAPAAPKTEDATPPTAKTMRVLVRFAGAEDAPGVVVLAPDGSSVAALRSLVAARVADRFGPGAKVAALALDRTPVRGAFACYDDAVFTATVSRDAETQVGAGARHDDEASDDDGPPKLIPRVEVAPPADDRELRATARLLYAELSLLTEGRDKGYKTNVRLALARAGWQVNDESNQELGAKPPAGWPAVGRILERSKNASKTSIRTITGSNGVVRYLELIANGASDVAAGGRKRKAAPAPAYDDESDSPLIEAKAESAFAAPVWKFAAMAEAQLNA